MLEPCSWLFLLKYWSLFITNRECMWGDKCVVFIFFASSVSSFRPLEPPARKKKTFPFSVLRGSTFQCLCFLLVIDEPVYKVCSSCCNSFTSALMYAFHQVLVHSVMSKRCTSWMLFCHGYCIVMVDNPTLGFLLAMMNHSWDALLVVLGHEWAMWLLFCHDYCSLIVQVAS